MKLSLVEVARYAKSAGFGTGYDLAHQPVALKELATAVAVCQAESRAETEAKNDSEPDGSTSYGLMQINSVHSELLATGDWRNPVDNMRMAYSLFLRAGKVWRDWGAYNSRMYLIHMPSATAAATVVMNATVPGEVIEEVSPVDEIKDTLKSLGDFFAFVTDARTWDRMGLILGGTVLLLLALWPLLKPVVSTVESVKP